MYHYRLLFWPHLGPSSSRLSEEKSRFFLFFQCFRSRGQANATFGHFSHCRSHLYANSKSQLQMARCRGSFLPVISDCPPNLGAPPSHKVKRWPVGKAGDCVWACFSRCLRTTLGYIVVVGSRRVAGDGFCVSGDCFYCWLTSAETSGRDGLRRYVSRVCIVMRIACWRVLN